MMEKLKLRNKKGDFWEYTNLLVRDFQIDVIM